MSLPSLFSTAVRRRLGMVAGLGTAALLALTSPGAAFTNDQPPASGRDAMLVLTPQMFGARCDSDGTRGNGTDDTAAIQAAIEAAQASGRTLRIPGSPTMCRVTATLALTRHIVIDGDYCQPYRDSRNFNAATRGPSPGAGSWLYFDHPGIGMRGVYGGRTGALTGGVIENVCTRRNQPAFVPSGSWTPATNDYDFELNADDWSVRHVMLLNPSKGLWLAGRVTIDDLRGDPTDIGINVVNSQDTTRIANVHFWPFSGINTAKEDYKRHHFEALRLGRIDNPDITNFMAISARICVHLVPEAAGVPNKLHGTNIDCDLVGDTGLLSEAPGATGQFDNFTTQGADPGPGVPTTAVNAIDINAPDNHFSFHGARFTNEGGVGVIAKQPGDWIDIDGLFGENWGINVPGTAAIEADRGATINIGVGPLLVPNRGSPDLYGGPGAINVAVSRKAN